MPEFLERRYDGRARLYFAALTLFLSVTVDAAAALYSGSLVIRVLFPGSPLWVIIVALAGAAGLYTVLGRSEEHTSELQSQSKLVCRLLLEKKNSELPQRDPPSSARGERRQERGSD